jgi:hypothetical protein
MEDFVMYFTAKSIKKHSNGEGSAEVAVPLVIG